jgi:DnaJ-class molecular chaperone
VCIVRICPKCSGSGVIQTSYPITCSCCSGTGVVTIAPLPRTATSYDQFNDDDGDDA